MVFKLHQETPQVVHICGECSVMHVWVGGWFVCVGAVLPYGVSKVYETFSIRGRRFCLYSLSFGGCECEHKLCILIDGNCTYDIEPLTKAFGCILPL